MCFVETAESHTLGGRSSNIQLAHHAGSVNPDTCECQVSDGLNTLLCALWHLAPLDNNMTNKEEMMAND